jgi:hypothetical protein
MSTLVDEDDWWLSKRSGSVALSVLKVSVVSVSGVAAALLILNARANNRDNVLKTNMMRFRNGKDPTS